MSTVSVIIPTWNRANTLKRAVLSVLNQTYPITEILVCDDGSTDDSKQVIDELKSEKIKWLEGKRAGMPSVPRNRGITASKGEWLAFLDSDDEWLPSKIEKQVELAAKLNTDAVCSNAYRVVPEGGNPTSYLNYSGEKISFEQLIKSNYIICSSAMFNRNLLEIVKGFPESPDFKAIEDYALWLRVATQTDFAYVQEPLVNYFDDPKQSIRDNKVTEEMQRKIILSDLMNWLEINPNKNPKHYKNLVKAEGKKAKGTSKNKIFSLFRK